VCSAIPTTRELHGFTGGGSWCPMWRGEVGFSAFWCESRTFSSLISFSRCNTITFSGCAIRSIDCPYIHHFSHFLFASRDLRGLRSQLVRSESSRARRARWMGFRAASIYSHEVKNNRIDDKTKHYSKTKLSTKNVHDATRASSLAVGPANSREEKGNKKQTEGIDKWYTRIV